MELFLINAIIGGIGASLLTSMLGNIILWKKMSYFGDALSHSSFLGISISLAMQINPILGPLIISIFFSISLMKLKTKLDNDTSLGILAQSSLALAVIIVSFSPNIRVDLIGYLFGDILTITSSDLYIIYVTFIIEAIWIAFNWRKLVLMCTDKNLAKAAGINTNFIELQLTIIMSITVVVCIKIVGALLITAMLVMPAAAAKNIAKSPLSMLFYSILLGILSVLLGIYGSIFFNSPTGPSIIIASLAILCISWFKKQH
jgi:zinc transport system permease protein